MESVLVSTLMSTLTPSITPSIAGNAYVVVLSHENVNASARAHSTSAAIEPAPTTNAARTGRAGR